MTVSEALEAGILDEVVPPESLLSAAKSAIREGRVRSVQPWDEKGFALPGPAPDSAEVMDLFTTWNAKVLAETGGHQPAPKAILSCVFEGTRVPIDAGLKIERDYFGTLVTGDVKYHEAQRAVFSGLNIIDAGHQPTELPVLDDLADRLSLRFSEASWNVVVNVASESLLLKHI